MSGVKLSFRITVHTLLGVVTLLYELGLGTHTHTNILKLVSSGAAKNALFVSGKIFSVVSMRIFGSIPDFKDNFLMGEIRNLADTV